MTKTTDTITTIEELDELTEYLVNPVNNDTIIEISDSHVETDKLIISFNGSIAKEAVIRMTDIVMGEIEWVEESCNGPIDTLTIDALFGKDKRANIVNIAIKNDLLYLFYLDGSSETIPCKYFILSSTKYDSKFERLEGETFYKYIRYFNNLESYNLFKKNNYHSISSKVLHAINDPLQQQLYLTGITLYKDLEFKSLRILGFDIETNGVIKDKNSSIKVITNTLWDGNSLTRTIFREDHYKNEGEMLVAWSNYVQEVNPSVMTGHNIFGFDLPYMMHVAKLNKVELNISRDGGSPIVAKRARKYRVDGSQTWDFFNIEVFGRDIIDGMFLAVKYDVGRNFSSWGLKSIIEALGLVKEGRQFYDASKIGENWSDLVEREKIVEYCKDDGDDSISIFNTMTPAFFYLARSIPNTLQNIINSASGSWLNSIIVRAYMQNGKSIAKPNEPTTVTGGISFGIPGIHKNVKKIDIVSMYPSIMREWKIFDDKKDPDAIFNKMVECYTLDRLKHKKLFKETKNSYHDDMQASLKIAINSLYGLNATSGLNYNNFQNADKITTLGRLILRASTMWASGEDVDFWFPEYKNLEHDNQYFDLLKLKDFTSHNFLIVNGDTDSISFKKKDESPFTEEETKTLLDEINNILPNLITFEDDGTFPVVVVLKAKNYVLYDGKKVKFKGSSLRSSRQEPALKEMMDRILKDCLVFEKEDYVKVYNEYIREILDIKDISRWAKKESVTDTMFDSDRLTETKKVEAILGMGAKVGDKVFLYNALDGEEPVLDKDGNEKKDRKGNTKMQPKRILKHISNFNNDYELDHYLKRCYDSISILENVIDMEKIIDYTKKKNKELLEQIK
jgi:DNA polymerase elongation subunit (family B)